MAILRSVARTDTFEIQRQKINLIAQDLFTVQTSVGSGAFSMSDGSAAQPALYFTNAIDVGIFKGDESLYISAKGATVANFSETNLTALQDFRTLISSIPTGAAGITITNGGADYAPGTFSNVLLSGGTGKGVRAEVEVAAIAGEILSGGGGYTGGSYLAVPLTGGTGTNALADITVIDFSGTIQLGGTGGNPIGAGQQATFTNVTLTGGSGNGMLADITVTDGGADVNVTSVLITNQGSGYLAGDVLSAPPAQIGNVSGFEYVIVGVGNVSQVSIALADDNYSVGDILTASDADLGNSGNGSGFQFEVTGVGVVTDISVSSGGDGYIVGDVLSVDPIELSPAEEYWVKMEFCQLVTFSGSTGSGFNVGDTLTYNGGSRPIVKKFADAVTIEASGTTGGTLTFSAGLQADDGNGNSLTVTSIDDGEGNPGALNYFFAPTANGPWTNCQDFTFEKNKRYVFDQTDGSNAGHPLRFSTTIDGIHTLISGVGANAVYGEIYEGDEVDYNYTSTAIAITPNEDTPTTLYYFCEEGIADQLNEHINEGGFNNREGVITVSGTATISGDGALFTVGVVNNESNIILQKDGTATLGDTTLNALEVNSTLSVTGVTTLSNNLIIGASKFVVDFNTGDTVIDGGLSVAGDLTFLSSAAFASTLYVDGDNNKVSVNIDPDVTPLTKDFEVSGTFAADGAIELATADGSILKVGNPALVSKAARLQVDGDTYTRGRYSAPPTNNILSPTYTFDGADRIGLLANGPAGTLSISSTTGELIRFEPLVVSSYRNYNFDKLEVLTSILEGGEGYVQGTYAGVEYEGGTGAGFFGNITIAFSVTTTEAGEGYTDGTGLTGSFTTSGSGTSAQATFDIASGAIENLVITDGGTGYLSGDTLTLDSLQIFDDQGDPVAQTPTVDATFTIDKLGVVTVVDVAVSGEGYLSGDTLAIPNTNAIEQAWTSSYNQFLTGYSYNVGDFYYVEDRLYEVTTAGDSGDEPPTHTSGSFENGTTFVDFVRYIKHSYTIATTTTSTTIELDKTLGKITLSDLETTGGGIVVDNKLSIDSNIISSLQDEDIIFNPGSSQKVLSVSGTGGVKIPVGDSTNRPAATTLGIIRYNSSTQQYEGSNGSDFISLGGVRDVDGNTYILAEEFVGANDNTLWFYNDAINTARLTTTEFTLITPQVIASREISPPKVEWEAGASATAAVLPLVNYVYYGDNLYSVDSTGTFDADENNAPTHTSGTVLNGSVDLTFVSTVFGPLTFKASNITLDATLSLSGLDIYSYNTTALVLDNSLTTTEFAFGKENGAPDTLALLTQVGELQFNRNYNTTDPQDNLTVLDSTLKFIELDDVLIKTASVELEKGVSDSAVVSIYDPTLHTAAKVMVIADNTTSDTRHMVEYSVVSAGTDIFVTEFGSVHTNIELFQVTFDFGPSGEVRINPVLNSAITAGDLVKIVTTFTITKK